MNAPFNNVRLQSTLRKMGNSTGMIVPKTILDQLGLTLGTKVELRIENGEVIARPAPSTVREGWKADAMRIGSEDLTNEDREWLDFDQEIADDARIPPEWLGGDA